MTKMMKAVAVCVAITLAGSCASAQGSEEQAARLIAQAKSLENPSSIDQALTLVAQAAAMLEERAPRSLQRAGVLDYEALLMMAKAQLNGTVSRGPWRAQVLPLATEALTITEGNQAGQDDLATALETKAEALATSDEAEALRRRATEIRKRLVQERLRADNSKSCTQPDATPGTLTANLLPRSNTSATLSFVVNKQGLAQDIKLVRSAGFGLDERAAAVMTCWRFRPAMRRGHPVAAPATVEVKFKPAWSVDGGAATEASGGLSTSNHVTERVQPQ